MKYLLSAWSPNMLPEGEDFQVRFEKLTLEEANALYKLMGDELVSFVGHEDTASLMGALLGGAVKFNRANVKLQEGDQCLVGLYNGGRLPAGATELPEGATLTWWGVSFTKLR